ncbi:MAG: HNH nuclease [Xanthobacteraceae bacterium]|nr:MAG: HNH nuclease [Xanthobacteraceae bacterium]
MSRRRSWSTRERLALFLKYDGRCHLCGGRITPGEKWEVSHEIPLELGGDDDDVNGKPAHVLCHRTQTTEVDIPAIAKAKRRNARHLGAKAPSRHRLPAGKGSKWKRKIDGTVVPR